jgi:hypothetical protein
MPGALVDEEILMLWPSIYVQVGMMKLQFATAPLGKSQLTLPWLNEV